MTDPPTIPDAKLPGHAARSFSRGPITTKPQPPTKTCIRPVGKNRNVVHLAELVEDLRAIATTATRDDLVMKQMMDAVAVRTRLLGVASIEFTDAMASTMIESRFKTPAMDTPAIRQSLMDSAALAVEQDTQQLFETDKMRGSLIVCEPFFKNDQTTIVFCGLFHDERSKCIEALMISHCVAQHFDLWRSRNQLTTLTAEIRNTASVLELIGIAECCSTKKEACIKIANELQTIFRCDYVAVGLKRNRIASCQLMAVSAMSEHDRTSRATALMQNAFDESILHGGRTSFPDSSGEPENPGFAQAKLAQYLRCEAAISIPIRNQKHDIVGAITVLGNRELSRSPSTLNLIAALEHPLGSCLELVKHAEGGALRRVQRLLFSPGKVSTKWTVLILALLMLLALFLPVPYRVHSKCVAEPVIRSFSVAPHDGLLESTLAEPGDIVNKGQVLAKMDGREIGLTIANLVAQKNRAAKEHDAFLAEGKIPEAIQADLERIGLEAELNVLENKTQNLQIRATTPGIVLTGSLDKRENYPVTIGQTLYEIAPISPLRVELAIPAEEIMHVETGQSVHFRFDGFGTAAQVGVLEKIRPSSTIRDNENVFIAEVILPNTQGDVRPGMKGVARIMSQRRTIGWALFHRPWEQIVTAIGF